MIFLIPDFNTLATTTDMGVPLSDALTCSVHEVRNGQFSLTLTYPISGVYSEEIVPNAIIMAVPRPNANKEPFRIYEVDRTLQGIITARANHIAYDLGGSIVWGMTQTGINNVLTRLNQLCPNHFEIVNDGITDIGEEFNVIVPITLWNAIGGSNSLLSHFGGELEYAWDDYYKKCVITIHSVRGSAFKNTIIRYGINIVSLNRKQSVSEMYSNVMAFWSDGQNVANNVWSNDTSTGITAVSRYLILDCSKDYQTAPTQADLDAVVTRYISEHTSTAHNDLSVEYIPLEDTTDYAPLPVANVGEAIVGTSVVGDVHHGMNIDPLYLCDTVYVDASVVGVSATAECVEVIYDVLAERYSKVTIGTLQQSIVDTVDKLTRSI